jgi:hypothetical protein
MMSPTPSSPAGDEQISLREAIEDPHVWQYSGQGAQEEMEERIENLRLRTNRRNRQSWVPPRSERRHNHRQPAQHEDDVYGDNCDHVADDSRSGIIRLSAPTPPPFTVTAASEAEESDSTEETPTAAVVADLMRRESLWRADTDDEGDEISPRFGGLRRAPAFDYTTYSEWRARRERHIEPIRATQIGAPSRIEPSQSLPEDDNLIPPHARFFIAKNKSKITIKFHPAMSVTTLVDIDQANIVSALEGTSCSSSGVPCMMAISILRVCSSMATRDRASSRRYSYAKHAHEGGLL